VAPKPDTCFPLGRIVHMDDRQPIDVDLQTLHVYLMSFDDWPVFNEVYMRRVGVFGKAPRTTVQVAGLGLGRVKIEMVAHVRAP
jgi:enamine deaminase RidA (YjgF/YER057c/UK114 family)